MRRVATTAAGVLALDALSKALALRWLEGRVVQLGNLVELRLTRNTGMALGLGADSRLALLLPPLVVLAGAWLLRRYRLTAFTQTACGLVLGGFLGNFLNRLVSGHVLDMVQFPSQARQYQHRDRAGAAQPGRAELLRALVRPAGMGYNGCI